MATLCEMLAFAAERIMEAEVEARTGAAKWSRSQFSAGNPEQRISRPRLRHPRGADRARDCEAAQGQLLPEPFGAAPDGREGADGGDPGGLHPRGLDPGG